MTTETDGVKISTQEPEFAKAISIYKQGSNKYKNTLKELASGKTSFNYRKG